MDFSYTSEQEDFRISIIKFVEKELNSDFEKFEQSGVFPKQLWQKCSDFSLMALPFPEEYNGCGVDIQTTVISLEAFGYACKDNGFVHAVITQILCGILLHLFGSDRQKTEYLPLICSGEKIAAYAITETDAGSDILSMKTKARAEDDKYIINGEKWFISNGPIADIVFVFAFTNSNNAGTEGVSCFIIDKALPGYKLSAQFKKMGLETLQICELFFKDCSVASDMLLGKEGQGISIYNELTEWERIFLFSSRIGKMQKIYETCIRYAKDRRQFEQPIGNFQSISDKIANMKINIELGKLIAYKAAWLKDKKKNASLESSIGKLFISESLKKASLDAIQIHGAYGYMKEFEVEREFRDSIALTIYSGTSEIQRNLISKLSGL